MRWTPDISTEVQAMWRGGHKARDIRDRFGLSDGQFRAAKMRLNLHTRKPRALVIAADHPAAVEGRSIFKAKPTRDGAMMLKSGRDTPKLGARIVKGKWSGIAVYSLTLEERATCPRSCAHWLDCYGNHMPFAARQKHGAEFERRLERELLSLAARHPEGFAVRAHVLGDFYSTGYVQSWIRWLREIPALHVFGYTARDPSKPIGKLIDAAHAQFPLRWWVRFSNGPKGVIRTGADGITCPAQTGKTRSCATCGLCWATKKPIKFLAH
jgi:hypothetical protein